MTLRPYDPSRDIEAVRRIWREAGWLPSDRDEAMDAALEACTATVAELDGEAECLVLTAPGTIRHLREDLPFSCVAGVTTSRVARRQGLAGRLTARSIAADVAAGAVVAGLGMFEQGYYERLGFGTGSYVIRCVFDPSALRVEPARRPPRRITVDDCDAAHAGRLRRLRRHGGCNIEPPAFTRTRMLLGKNGFGLGYRREGGAAGELSHHVWLGTREDVEHGPYHVHWLAYETREQLLELLGLLRTLGDQIRQMSIAEPPFVQFQDLVQTPFRRMWTTSQSARDTRSVAMAYWQIRICDVPRCLAMTRLPSGEARFNLTLHDPIERYLDDADGVWRGVGGRYVVTLGTSSGAEPGTDASLPTLEASVGAFSRLWLGVRPATGLAASDDLTGPEPLLEMLDDVLRLPQPMTDWDF